MKPGPMVHDTFVLEREFPVEPRRVFLAYADPAIRSLWGVPTDEEALVYSASEFRVGGFSTSPWVT